MGAYGPGKTGTQDKYLRTRIRLGIFVWHRMRLLQVDFLGRIHRARSGQFVQSGRGYISTRVVCHAIFKSPGYARTERQNAGPSNAECGVT